MVHAHSERVPARIDGVLVVLVVLALLLAGLIVAPLLLDPRVAPLAKWVVGGFGLGALVLTFGLAVPVRYWLEPQGLTVRAGLLLLRFAYPDIVRVDRVISPLSGPAWSLVRLRVALHGGGWVEIAPRDREWLLQALARRAPQLKPAPRGLADPQRVQLPLAARGRRAASSGRKR